jgi:hypothetical protein
MKRAFFFSSIGVIILTPVFVLVSPAKTTGESTTTNYVIILYTPTNYQSPNEILVFYGSGQQKEELKLKTGETPDNRVIDLLNKFKNEGYDLVSVGQSHYNIYNDRQEAEIACFLVKR